MAYEHPPYAVDGRFEGVELRSYLPYLVAETEVVGDRQGAGTEGFRRLAGYIFGNNKGDGKVAGTAPMSETRSVKIAMTAPVAEQPAGSPGTFLIQFMMPSRFTRDSLPEPLDPRIHFREMPARRVAALRYSGTWSERRYRRYLGKLLAALSRARLQPVGEPVWTRYDPPFKPWFLRRNEIWVEVGPG